MFVVKGTRVHATTVLVACCAALWVAAPCRAASIPAWLDDGISGWNAKNPATPIRFVDIKDSFVWYDVARTPEIGQQRLREAIREIVNTNGYEPMGDEDLVTTAKPPAQSGPSGSKKCWRRSFVLNIQSQSHTKAVDSDPAGQRQRMLTSLVCEDASTWWAAFRIAE